MLPSAPKKEAVTEESDGRTTRKKMSMLRRKIATQLVNVQQTAAILTTFNEADMTAIMKLRKAVQEDFVAKYGVKLGFTSFFVKAVVQGLKEVQNLNAKIDGNDLVQNHFYDVGVAVGTEKGLVVPVIRDADRLSLAGTALAIHDLSSRARDKKLSADDLRGGTFTISNPGLKGNLYGFAIINQPQVGILRMGEIAKRAVVRTLEGEDAIVIRTMMYLALSYDHRAVDGAPANGFLHRIRELLEAADFEV